MRIIGRIVGVQSTEQSVGIILAARKTRAAFWESITNSKIRGCLELNIIREIPEIKIKIANT
jgi:hypothetical protein